MKTKKDYESACEAIIEVLKQEGGKLGIHGDFYVQYHRDNYLGIWYWAVLLNQPEADFLSVDKGLKVKNERMYSFVLPDKDIDRGEVTLKLEKVMILMDSQNPFGEMIVRDEEKAQRRLA